METGPESIRLVSPWMVVKVQRPDQPRVSHPQCPAAGGRPGQRSVQPGLLKRVMGAHWKRSLVFGSSIRSSPPTSTASNLCSSNSSPPGLAISSRMKLGAAVDPQELLGKPPKPWGPVPGISGRLTGALTQPNADSLSSHTRGGPFLSAALFPGCRTAPSCGWPTRCTALSPWPRCPTYQRGLILASKPLSLRASLHQPRPPRGCNPRR